MTREKLTAQVEKALSALEGDDWRENPAQWSSKTVEFVRENDVSFLLDLGEDPQFVQQEREERERLLSELTTVQQSLDTYGVPFSLIKFPIVEKPIGDIDLLIPSRVNRKNAFKDAGYRLDNRTEPHREAYVKEFEDGLVTFDVHTRASWRRVEYLDAIDIVEQHATHTLENGTTSPIPRPEHEILVVAAHSMFDEGSVSLFEALYGYYLLEELDADRAEAEELAARYNWRPVFVRFCRLAEAVGEGNQTRLLTSFPYDLSLRDTVGSRVRKTYRDARDRRMRTVGRELVAYPQDIVVRIVEDELGVSMVPFFRLVTRAKRRLTPDGR